MMRLSVIIPAIDEAERIGRVIDRVVRSPRCEVIVVDGGSDDATAGTALRHGARVVRSSPGRGRQMNAGAATATGATLLFLHADTLLPPGFERHVFETLERPGVVAGAFALRIDAPQRSLRLVERAVALRCRWRELPYGDQAIFMSAGIFHDAGGFPDVPVMEDYELMRLLRARGRIAIADAAVLTSARRWLVGGVWRTTLLNQACIAAWRLGVSSRWIAAWRGQRALPEGSETRAAPSPTVDGGLT